MMAVPKWVSVVIGFLLSTILGGLAGVVLAFVCVTLFFSSGPDAYQTIGFNFVFHALFFGAIGMIAGFLGGFKILDWVYGTEMDGLVKAGALSGETDR